MNAQSHYSFMYSIMDAFHNVIEPGLSINAHSLIQNGEEDEEGTPEQDHPSKVTIICSYSITIALFTTLCISVYTLPHAPLGSLGGSATVPDGNTSTTDYSHYSYCHFLIRWIQNLIHCIN